MMKGPFADGPSVTRALSATANAFPPPSPELLQPRPRTPAQPSLHPPITLRDLMAADEETALRAFRQLARGGAKQVYVLAGGIPAWLELFANASSGTPALLAGAFGGRHPASYPDVEHMALPKFEPKVRLGASGAKKGPGGCGG